MQQEQRLKIGIVGLNFGQWAVSNLLQGEAGRHFELAGVCDVDRPKATEIAQRAGVPAFFDLDALLARDDIPVIGLFTGPVGRAELLRRVIRAGKDVMTTKPFELDADAAMSVLLEARKLGRVIHLNSPSPLLPPELRQIRQWQRDLSLGRPIACRIDTWANYREKADGKWYDDPDKCPVPPIFRLGIYLINDLVRFFGPAESVQVLSSRLFTGRPTADHAQLGIRFADGGLANVFASFCVNDGQSYRNALTMNFENGTAYRNIDPADAGRADCDATVKVVTRGNDKETVIRCQHVQGVSGQYQWDVLRRAIGGEKLADEVTPEEIVAGIRIINAMRQAEKTGATVKV